MSETRVFFRDLPASSPVPEIGFTGPSLGGEVEEDDMFVFDESASGDTVYVAQLMDKPVFRWRIMLDNLTEQEAVDLATVWRTILKGPSVVFTYVHTDGRRYDDARLMLPRVRATRAKQQGRYQLEIIIRTRLPIDNPGT